MRFSSVSLNSLLLAASMNASVQAFTVGSNYRVTFGQGKVTSFGLPIKRVIVPTQLFSSTLDKEETITDSSTTNSADDGEVANDEADDSRTIVAVSANHVVSENGRIIEGSQYETGTDAASSALASSDDNADVGNTVSFASLFVQPRRANEIKPLLYQDESHNFSQNSAHEQTPSLPHVNDNDGGPDDATTVNGTSSTISAVKMISTMEFQSEQTSNNGITMTKAEDILAEVDTETSTPTEEESTPSETAPTVIGSTNDDNNSGTTFTERVTNSGVASAAAMATAAVNAAVAMRSLEAPTVDKSYISLDASAKELDEDGLPLVYDKDAIEKYWAKERGALNKRWGYFVGKAVPFLTRMTALFIKDGKIEDKYIPELSQQARIDLQDLGPTFIKAGQMMSVRPDVLPQPTLDELTKLQDGVVPFSTTVAVEQIERELGGPLGQFFTSISTEPVAAASLAQVYRATLNDGKDTVVAIKVQRPDVLSTVSKDLYVLRRAAEVFQGLVERFAPQQRTNYVALLNEWSIGFYTELDFQNEAKNQQRLRDNLKRNNIKGITVPKVFEDMCTRRILVSEWIDGVKLSQCEDEEIAELIPICQEAFLAQLFEDGFFHADPHPGNILRLNEPNEDGDRVALIDCGLMASIDPDDRDNMISAVIHLANKDYASLVDDFMNLNILPADSDRAAIIPLMDKALTPYVKGGGAKKYEEELMKLYGMEDGSVQSKVGGFQAMTQDALTVLNDVPFSIPAYFAILGRAIVTLEGVALTGNPDYGIIMESYPFIARKLMSEDRPEIQRALQEVLYSGNSSESGSIKFNRLLALLNNAAGAISTQEGAAFVDLDTVPEDGLSFADGLKFLLSDKAESLRNLLESEVDNIVDIITRQIIRQGVNEAVIALSPPRPPALPFLGDIFPATPKLEEVPLPIVLPPTNGNTASIGMLTLREFTDIVAPRLNQDEELYALSLSDAIGELFGEEVAEFVRGESVISVKSVQLLFGGIRSGILSDTNLLNSENAKAVLGNVEPILSRVAGAGNGSSGNLEQKLKVAVAELNEEERKRLDFITEELTKKSITRATERLSGVPRVL